MRKFFILLTLISGFHYSKAQTKEETIDWIKSKLEKNLYNGLNKNFTDKIELNECFCTIYYTSKTNMGELKNIVKFSTNIKSIVTNSWIVPSTNNIEHFVYKQKKKKIVPISRSYDKENTFPLYVKEGEENLSVRLFKAFRHLNQFCASKEEAF